MAPTKESGRQVKSPYIEKHVNDYSGNLGGVIL